MQISSRFTIAIHIFACIDVFKGQYKLTSDFLAGSINVNPVVIRRLLQQLKAAGLITVARGSGGAAAAKPLDEITFLDVYRAVDCVESRLSCRTEYSQGAGQQAGAHPKGDGGGNARHYHRRCNTGYPGLHLPGKRRRGQRRTACLTGL